MVAVTTHESGAVAPSCNAESQNATLKTAYRPDIPCKNTWRDLLARSASDLTHAVVALPLLWRNAEFNPEMSSKNKLKHIIAGSALLSSWQSVMGIKDHDLNLTAVIVVNRYFDYVNAVDNYIDASKKGPRLDFTKDDEIKRIRRHLFSSISGIEGEKEIRQLLIKSDDTMMKAVVRLKEKGISNLEDALKFRSETSGELLRTMIAILDIAHNLQGENAYLQKDYSNLSMALQIYDDVKDLTLDYNKRTAENLMFQTLKSHPQELKAVEEGGLLEDPKIDRKKLARLAPESFKEVKVLWDSYLSMVPNTPDYYGIKTFVMRLGFRI